MRVVWDIDGVVKEFSAHFLSYLNLDPTPARDWDDPRFRDNFHLIEHDTPFWETVPDLFDLSLLHIAPIAYCTARPCSSEVTGNSLKNAPKAKIITVGMNNSKIKAVTKVRGELVLDDAIHNFEDFNNNGINCLLVTRSHNESYPEKHVTEGGRRIDGLLEFQELFYNKDDNGIYVFNRDLYGNCFRIDKSKE